MFVLGSGWHAPAECWHWDRDGKPIGWVVWAWLMEQPSYQRVARGFAFPAAAPEQLYCVSTVWMGFDLNHGFARHRGAPMMFETAAFRAGTAVDDEKDEVLRGERIDVCRSATEKAAVATHDRMMAAVAAQLRDPVVTHLPVVPARPRGGWTGKQEALSVRYPERASRGCPRGYLDR